jgi:hypothetical protein
MTLLKTEFHCHTNASPDGLPTPKQLVDACRKRGIDRVIVTDHNTIAGALEAQRIAPDLVIIGEEIMTTQGELLCAFVTDEIPAGLDPRDAITKLRAQGAFISVSHPFDRFRDGAWRESDLLAILPLVDAIEVFNARCFLSADNDRARAFAETHDIPGTCGSDAHSAMELGRGTLLLPTFSGGDDLRSVIRQGIPQTRLSSPFIHFTSRFAKIKKSLNL